MIEINLQTIQTYQETGVKLTSSSLSYILHPKVISLIGNGKCLSDPSSYMIQDKKSKLRTMVLWQYDNVAKWQIH